MVTRDDLIERVTRLEERVAALWRVVIGIGTVTAGLLAWAASQGFDLGGVGGALAG